MEFIVPQFLFILFGLTGLIVWALSDLPMAVREIAINTRRDPGHGSSYVLIKVLSICLKILAVLIWIFGVAAVVGSSLLSSHFQNILQGVPNL
jgi:predicted benzoate:H+ symporter BenE